MRRIRRSIALSAVVAPMALALAVPASAGAEPDTAAEPAGGPLPCDEPALSHAAAELLLDGTAQTPEALERAARRAGSDRPAVHAMTLREGQAARLRGWLGRLRRRSDAPLVCGEARAEGRRLVLAAARAGALIPVPGDSRLLRAHLAEGFDEPRLVVRGAGGEHRRVALERPLDAVAVPSDVALPALVQLVARGPVGPRPVAELRIGEADDGQGSGESGDGRTRPIATDPWKRLSALRDARGAGALRPNRLLSDAASAHAERVCAGGAVGHELEPGVDPQARLGRRQLDARVVGEVVARGETRDDALAGLEDSPSHLMTMVDRRFTDGGWGVAESDDGRTCLVILLAAWPRYRP